MGTDIFRTVPMSVGTELTSVLTCELTFSVRSDIGYGLTDVSTDMGTDISTGEGGLGTH